MLSKLFRKLPQVSASRIARGFGLVQSSNEGGVEKKARKLQFSKERLVDFGELPRGEIPDALNYDPENHVTATSNGVTVGTEVYGTNLVTIGFHWKYGSRHETQESSGVTHFIQKLRFRGTASRSRLDIEREVSALGGQFHQEVDKERNSLYVTVQKDQVGQAFALVGDLLNNSTFHDNQVEAEREGVYRAIVNLQKDMLETTLENALFTSYRDHQLGQPTLGARDNVANISAETIKKFVAANHHANNFAVIATGPVNHTQITELTEKHFGNLVSSEAPLANTHQAMYTPSLMYVRDDEMANINAGVFLPAPSFSHPDSHVMKYFVALLGNYRADKHTATNLNDPSRQYNVLHEHLGNLPDISLQQTFYLPYSDTGLIGSYVLGNELFGPQIVLLTQQVLSNYALEVFRARVKLFNQLLNRTSSVPTNREFATEVLNLGRRIPRSESAFRISANADQGHIQRIAKRWFYDVDMSAVAWGPLHNIAVYGHYNRVWKRSTLGSYGSSPAEIL